MRRTLGIARLALAEGLRMRIVLVFLLVLVVLVVRMPFTLRGDETIAGRVQNFLAYALGAMSVLLSLITVFFSCATLAGEFRSKVLQSVVTKPVRRIEILLGKWLGVNVLVLIVIVAGGAAVYGLAYYLKSQPVQFERDRYKVRDVVWTARVAAKPTPPTEEADAAARQIVKERIERGELPAAGENDAIVAKRTELLRLQRVVPDGEVRLFEFKDLAPPDVEDAVIQVRYKAIGQPLTLDEMLEIGWVFCDPDTKGWLSEPIFTREQSNKTHQFLVHAGRVVKDGRAALMVLNPPSETDNTAFIFEGEKSLQILYTVGGFEQNFVRALAMLQLRMALLSAVALFFATFTSFPVACFCALSFYVICLGSPFWHESIGANLGEVIDPKVDPFGRYGPAVRTVLVPLLWIAFPDFAKYDGIDLLIDGLTIPVSLMNATFWHTLGYGAALLLGVGWLIFANREIAEVQV